MEPPSNQHATTESLSATTTTTLNPKQNDNHHHHHKRKADDRGNNNNNNNTYNNHNKRSKQQQQHQQPGGKKHQKQKQQQQRPGKNRRKPDGGKKGGDYDDDTVATINKGSLACPEMQLPEFGYFGNAENDEDEDDDDKAVGEGAVKATDKDNVVDDDDKQAHVGGGGDDNNNNKNIETRDATKKNTVKRRVAMVIGFVGSRYHGFQMQQQQRTLQSVLEYALYRAKYITTSNFGVPFKYGWSHSARTDRGVHAAAQVCSCKLQVPVVHDKETEKEKAEKSSSSSSSSNKEKVEKRKKKKEDGVGGGGEDEDNVEEEGEEEAQDAWYDSVIRETINAHLPDDVRILNVVRTTRNFCARKQRDQVRYQYWFPSFILMPDFDSFWKKHASDGEGTNMNDKNDSSDGGGGVAGGVTPQDPVTIEQWHKCRTILQDYRMPDDQLQLLEQAVQAYQGTHSFHNFTKGVESGQAQALRYIIECSVQKKYMTIPTTTNEIGGDTSTCNPVMMEWISADIVGQSFLLNQIRKMMSFAIDVARGKAPLSTLTRMLERQQHQQQHQQRRQPPPPPPPVQGSSSTTAAATDINNNKDDDSTAVGKQQQQFRVGVAPAQGLFLDLSYYPSYNRKTKNLKLQPLLDRWADRERQENNTTPSSVQELDNAKETTTTTITNNNKNRVEDGYQRWKEFKQNVILPHMVKEEWEQGNFLKYLVQQEYFFDHVTYYQLESHHHKDDGTEQPPAPQNEESNNGRT